MDLESKLSRALAIRIKLQVSLASMEIIEEWMDIHLTRWIESVPLPPELPMGHRAHFGVSLSTDLSRLRWEAYGNPAGFIPKMADYLQKCGMSGNDTQLLDTMGNDLEPELVGSWVGVIDKKIVTGWQFCDEYPFAAIESMFGDHEAKRTLMQWMSKNDITSFRRFSQSIGDEPFSEIELVVPGVALDDQLDRVGAAFDVLTRSPLPDSARTAMSNAVSPGFAISVRMRHGEITRVSAISPSFSNDVIAQLCADAGIVFHDKLGNVAGSLGADGADRIAFNRTLASDESSSSDSSGPSSSDDIDVYVIPSDSELGPPPEMN